MTKELFPSTRKTKEGCYFNAVNPEYDRDAMEKAKVKPTAMVNVPKWNDALSGICPGPAGECMDGAVEARWHFGAAGASRLREAGFDP